MKDYYQCAACQSLFSQDHCQHCNTSVDGSDTADPATKLYSPFSVTVQAALRMLKGYGNVGQFVGLTRESQTLGTRDCRINIKDDFLSAQHAAFTFDQNGDLFVEDLESVNGIYVRVDSEILLKDKDMIRAGNHIFLFEKFDESCFDTNTPEYFLASTHENVNFRIVEILRGGVRGRAHTSSDGDFVVGRSKGHFNFRDDDTMSAAHFKITWIQGEAVITDLNSANGTFLRVSSACRIKHGDEIFLGDTLLRVII